MTKKLNVRLIFNVLIALIVVAGTASCSKDVLRPNELSAEGLVSGRLDGTWTSPRDIVTPANVPSEIFGSMRLVFTTNEKGEPVKFIAHDSPIVFGTGAAADWTATAAGDSTSIKLTGVGPVDDFKVKVSSNFMTISFYMGWENTETKATGKGNFKVTLARQ
ncbi:MAG: hypothetical protein EOP46_02780 [Sphingobacteriaceae bacterium]|nr:MAG: hypothetical protein EOP46_02780 [Sphingobacteriaceae bacterium]